MRSPRIDHYEDHEIKVIASSTYPQYLQEIITQLRWAMRDARADGYRECLMDMHGLTKEDGWIDKEEVEQHARARGIDLDG